VYGICDASTFDVPFAMTVKVSARFPLAS